MTTLASILAESKARLATDDDIDDPAVEARILVENLTATTRTDAIARPEMQVTDVQAAAIRSAVERRLAGEPPYRILGWREFYGLRLALSPGTLEPRPDTETLVDAILPFVRATASNTGACRILDLGTGTGAIALALLSQEPRATATGADLSDDALATAVANASALGLAARFRAVKSDWFSNISGAYHAIVANPPYIPSSEVPLLERGVRDFDPRAALDGGADGLQPYRTIASQAIDHIEASGRVAVEFGHDQRQAVEAIFGQAGYRTVAAHRDLGGNERALVFALA